MSRPPATDEGPAAGGSAAGGLAATSPGARAEVLPVASPDIERTSPARSRPGLDPAALEQLRATAARHFPESAAAAGSGADVDALISSAARCLEVSLPSEAADVEVGLRAALALAEMRLDPATLAATLVVAVPSAASAEGIAERLGAEVALLVEGANRLGEVRWDRLEDERVETLRK